MSCGVRVPYYANVGESTVYSFDSKAAVTDTVYFADGVVYNKQFDFEPRISLSLIINENNSIKANYAKHTQALHLVTNSESPFTSLDVWMPISPNIKHQVAHQYSLSHFYTFRKVPVTFSTEVFYKTLSNQIDYEEHANMLLNPNIEGELIFGKGWSYGLELLLRKNSGNFEGWIGYTLAKAYRQFKEINKGEPFSASFDRLHDFVLYGSYNLSKRWKISGSWLYATGATYTEPTGFFKYQNYTIPIYSEKNNERLPDYHRLDLMLSFRINKRNEAMYKHQITVSVFNVYARENPFNITYNKVKKTNTDEYEVPSDAFSKRDIVHTELYLLKVVPSLSYIFKVN
ncbi:MAG: TonB-dependent receptor [Bacteroidales bacterium]|nr:TonB-dependent receptor [Bacteroidales bacterium]